jgi:lipoprotein-releasing system permease protein
MTWLPFEAWVSMRFMREGRAQTAIIVSGISIGVAVIVFMSALLAGLQNNFVHRALTGQSHIQVQAHKEVVRPLRTQGPQSQEIILQAPLQRLKSIDQWQSAAAQMRAMPDVLAVSPAVTGAALVTRGDTSLAISLTGITPELYDRVVPLPEKIVLGKPQMDVNTIFIGTDLATHLGVTPGDMVRVSAANGAVNTLKVGAILDLGNKGANSRSTFVSLRTGQSLLGLAGSVSVIDVMVRDVYAAELVAQRISRLLDLESNSWIKTNEQFFTALRAQTIANTTIRFCVALSVGFGIASVLVVSIVQRSREIGIFRAMGITRGQILRIFLLQGGLLGMLGAVAGSMMGGVALLLWQRYMRNADGTVMFPISLEPVLIIEALALATLTGLVAAFAPALHAARLDPVIAIRR